MLEQVQHTLPPWVDEQSLVLVLGTMPSPQSRLRGIYYGHRQNRFWPVIAALWQEELPHTPKQAQALASRCQLALWDVLASCTIKGAADSTIANPVPNDIPALLARYPNIRYIATTGRKAEALYKKYLAAQTGLNALALPSTSAANRGRFPLAKLIDAYRPLYNLIKGETSLGSSKPI